MDGKELNTSLLRYAYQIGCFPMTMDDASVEWFQPHRRALFPISGVHVSRSLARTIKSQKFEITFDQAFREVMKGCLRPDGNWISDDFIRVYSQAHSDGWGHSCEVWNGGILVGGIYGVSIGGYFAAESMFHRETNASKIALWAMVEKCRALGFKLFDAQIMNPHLSSLGAYEVDNSEFMAQLTTVLNLKTPWSTPAVAKHLQQTP